MKGILQFALFYFMIGVFCSSNALVQRHAPSKNRYTTPNPLLHPINEEVEATSILQAAAETASKFYLKLREEFLSYGISGNNEDEKKYRGFKSQLAFNLSRFNYDRLNHTKRQVMRLSRLQLDGLDSEQYDKAINLLKHMESLSIIDNVYNMDRTIKYSYRQTILKKIQVTVDPEELLYYWREWRSVTGEDIRKSLIEYKNFYRKAATLNGHVTPSKTWYLYYEDDNFLEELTKVIQDLMPLYKELHAYIRRSIKERYDNKVPYHGPIPHHFMEQVLEQDWYSKSAFSVPYPHNPLPDVNIALKKILPNATSIFNAAIYFYEKGLSLEPFPAEFYRSYAKELTEHEAGVDCKAIAKKFPPDYGIKYCPVSSYKKFLQMHQAIGKLEYYKQSIHLPIGLNDEACPGFADAIGEAAVIAAGSPRHLDKMDDSFHYMYNKEWKMNRLFRMAVHTLFSVFQYFVHEKFWVDFLDGKITEENMNCEYWKLQLEWAGVSPPEQRNEKTFDANYRFYKGISDERSSTRSLISEILGYQFYKAFCKYQLAPFSGDDNNPINTLSTCDIFGNTEIGKKMSSMMSLGSSRNWREVVYIVTQSKELDAGPMNEYYAPLLNWLRQDNQKHHVLPGWNKKELCESD